ncbi:hypothetical protein NDU88_001272 [Pleurodeles waltl]|uniref:Uncharacterized protein n=1 Tax=Pleurodeles waltl TaxID=8319 RepID=A0AAV7U7Y0_PLEWA|nr:hypothetical protein NDU88_001272 [Pleurodeles waltl]
MPRNKPTKETPISSLWIRPPKVELEKMEGAVNSWDDPPAPMNITQDILTSFLKEIRTEIDSLKDDLKLCIKDVYHEVTEIRSRVNDLEQTVDARSEDQELLWRHVNVLELLFQGIELESKQEDLKNRS